MTHLFSSMKRWLAALLLSSFVPAVALVPVVANAAAIHTDRTIAYSTSLQELNKNWAPPLVGDLHVRLAEDGVVSGYYQAAYSIHFVPVTGGVDGDHVWLLIGSTSPTRVEGTYHNGAIVGTAYTPDNNIYRFAATNPVLQK
ncbi:MAG TPA: hypothetical protein VFN49_00750 [Candidatus Aquilonibacter sp.]|nr:hypothetical protein [Candidatus Aquilonibacter sp.]